MAAREDAGWMVVAVEKGIVAIRANWGAGCLWVLDCASRPCMAVALGRAPRVV